MILDGIPVQATKAREDWIFQAVCAGRSTFDFAEITSTHEGRTARFQVFQDALKIDGIRVNVSAETAQKIADVLGCSLLTPKLADLIWLQKSIRLSPHPRAISSDTSAMIDHSTKIDVDLLNLGNPRGIICTVGKHWVIDNDLANHTDRAENYGWHFDGTLAGIPAEHAVSLDGGGHPINLIQGRGTRHDMHHVDYSQVCVLVSKQCSVDGVSMEISDLLKNPDLAPLASHQGVMNVLRQPGVPEVIGISALPMFVITPDDLPSV